jgi:arsenite-transporting ATPase
MSKSGKAKQVTMFAGKGGVGKTTCAGATALHYALEGQLTLVISTDPTPSLSDIFELKTSQKPARVRENLHLLELGLEEVKEMWDKKFGHEVYEVFSTFVSIGYEEFVDFITSILPGLGEEFMVDYIKELSRSERYEKIIWDTAPLGQTMGLLKMPGMLREHLKAAPRVYSQLRLGSKSRRPVLDIIKEWEKLSGEDIEFLRSEVEFVMVTIPEALAVQQLERVFSEFESYSLRFSRLIINNVIQAADSDFLQKKAQQQRGYLDLLHQSYDHLKVVELPLFPYEIRGLRTLGEVRRLLF